MDHIKAAEQLKELAEIDLTDHHPFDDALKILNDHNDQSKLDALALNYRAGLISIDMAQEKALGALLNKGGL